MFDRLSGRYDFLNHFLSGRQDIRWREKAVGQFKNIPDQTILDMATGTGDLILTGFERNHNFIRGIGIDPAEKMLQIAEKKIHDKNLACRIQLMRGDGTAIPLTTGSVDGAMIAFGIRNFADFELGLREMFRVLKIGGRLVVLEFSLPENWLLRQGYLLYFRHILPGFGGVFSGDKDAYKYLNETVENFYYGKDFCEKMVQTGFRNVRMVPLTFGIATIYIGDKPEGTQRK